MTGESLFDELESLLHPLLVDVINLDSRADVAHEHVVIESCIILGLETIDVFLSEEDVPEVEQIEVILQEFSGELVIEVPVRVVLTLQHVGHMHGDLTKIGLGSQRSCRSNGYQKGGHEGQGFANHDDKGGCFNTRAGLEYDGRFCGLLLELSTCFHSGEDMTEISMFTGGIAQTNGYLVKLPCATILVDAPEGVAGWLKRHGANVDALLLTHQHFDHVLGAAEVVAQHSCPVLAWAPLSKDLTLETLLGAVTGTAYSVPEFTVNEVLDGRVELDLFTHTVKLLHVPGHSPDSVCFYLPDFGLLFGGDVLFLDGVGRTDFPGGSFQVLAKGIEQHLWPLPDVTVVYPGHGDKTTIGREREENPFLT